MEVVKKEIPGYLNYFADELGNIYLKDKKLPLFRSHGYLRTRVKTSKDKKIRKISAHRLTALAWIPNPENKKELNHINGIKNDNRVSNIEWSTRSENMLHAVSTGLTTTNMFVRLTDLVTNEVTNFPSLNQLAKFLDMGMDSLITFIPRSVKHPINLRYVITIDKDSISTLLNPSNTKVLPIFVYDHVTNTITNYVSVAHACIITGINTYTVREALGAKRMQEYYNGGYTFSYSEIVTPKQILPLKAESDREEVWAKPYSKNLLGIELYDYDKDEVTTFDTRNEVANFIGCAPDQVTGALVRSQRKNRTWLLSGYGIRVLGSMLSWYPYDADMRFKSKNGQRFDIKKQDSGINVTVTRNNLEHTDKI